MLWTALRVLCCVDWLIHWLYQSFTAHQHQKGHTVPKQVSPLDDDDDITRNKCYGSTVWELHCLRTALCESIHYQAKSEQNVRQDLIPKVRHGEAALCTPWAVWNLFVWNLFSYSIYMHISGKYWCNVTCLCLTVATRTVAAWVSNIKV